jgi:hypothetical protein
MPVTFTASRALLSTMATSLSAEATDAGLNNLATALTNLSTEISTTNSEITEREFFGGGSTTFSATGGAGGASPSGGSASGSGTDNDSAALVWSSMLDSAANIISTHNSNVARDIAVNNDSTQGIVSIANSVSMIENIFSTVSGNLSTMADKQTAIETYLKKLKELGEGDGIHMIGPYDWIGLISIYRLLVEQGSITEDEKGLTDSAKALNVETLKKYLQKIKSLPTNF